jgi:hypothetical protein
MLSRGVLSLDPREVALSQYVDGSCHRLDLHVRLLALEEWHGGLVGGVELYRRFVELKSADQGPTHTAEAFRALAEAVRRGGLQAPIVVSPRKTLRDGMHRLACAVFLEVDRIASVVDPADADRPDYTVGRLRAIGLAEADVAATLEAEARYRGVWLSRAGPQTPTGQPTSASSSASSSQL